MRPSFNILALGTAVLVLSYQPDLRSLGPDGPAPTDTAATTAAPSLPESLVSRNLLPFADQLWDRLTGNRWSYLKRSSSKDAAIVVDATAPFSPPNVLRIVFTPQLETNRDPSVHWIGLPSVSEVYATWWIKLSANWTASPAGGGKMTFLWPPQGNGVIYSAIGGSQPPHRIHIATTWPAYGYKFWEPNVSTTDVYYDRWYRIEWYVKWETSPGTADGIIRWWVNTTLNGDYTNVRFPACCLSQFEFAPTLQNPPPADQYMYIDHTWIATR
jgi:hypothetical protein